ncbi:MAG: hypothetical protein AAF658_05060 [Myxococcota bacterium]
MRFAFAISALVLSSTTASAEDFPAPSAGGALLSGAGLPVRDAPPLERWAGHQVVLGSQDLALLGAIDTRAESFVIADVRRYPDKLVMTQYTCRVAMAEAAGVQASMKDTTARTLPPVKIEIPVGDAGGYRPSTWVSEWGSADFDGDGEDGVTVEVDAPLCGGSLYLSSRTTTKALVNPYQKAIEAFIDVRVEQEILDTSNICLDLATSDSIEEVAGRVRYAPVASSSTCDSLFRQGWPVLVPL